MSAGVRWSMRIGVVVIALVAMALGTKVVSSDNPLARGAAVFNPQAFGAENFPVIQQAVADRAVDATTLAVALAAGADAAAQKYGVSSSTGTVFSVKFTGVAGEGKSGIYPVTIDGLPNGLLVRVQTGPAINGTDLRDATGKIVFGQFKNQIDYQNSAAALNDTLKTTVLDAIDTANLQGKTISVTGVFTLVNAAAWLVTPTELVVK
jgi:predicted lipoprotein